MLPVSAIQTSGIGYTPNVARPTEPTAANPGQGSFTNALAQAAEQVNTLQVNAADQSRAFALGQTSDIHSVMIASQKASVALELTTQIRNKVLEAYQTVMQMQM